MAVHVVHFFAELCKTTGSFEYGDAENNAEKLNLALGDKYKFKKLAVLDHVRQTTQS